MRTSTPALLATLVATLLIAPSPLLGLIQPDRSSPVIAKEFSHPDLYVGSLYRPASELAPELATSVAGDLALLGVAPRNAFYDPRSGRWGALIQSRPLVPGPGAGNRLSWSGLGRSAPDGDDDLKTAVWDALAGYLAAHRAELRIDLAELEARLRVTLHEGGRLVQIYAWR